MTGEATIEFTTRLYFDGVTIVFLARGVDAGRANGVVRGDCTVVGVKVTSFLGVLVRDTDFDEAENSFFIDLSFMVIWLVDPPSSLSESMVRRFDIIALEDEGMHNFGVVA